MHIAIQAADLDANRIDGTRVYLWQLLKRFGKIRPEDMFSLYHREIFNSQITPPDFSNYHVSRIPQPILWTQTRFAYSLWKDKPDFLWMPVQSIPLIRRKSLRTTVTIHDLAFRYFPEHFPYKDRYKLLFLADLAIKNADTIIAVSHHTKKDILHFYPKINPEKIFVVHHGYDGKMFVGPLDKNILKTFGLENSRYILYVGALQPRKNLVTLIHAFEKLREKESFRDLKLVLAGEKAWLWEEIEQARNKSAFREDILITGRISFDTVIALYRNACVFAYPSLYEGFGLPILEAFSAQIPVVCSRGSSLDEVGGDAVISFDPYSVDDMSTRLEEALTNEFLRKMNIQKGRERLALFSWDICAQKTLDIICGQAKNTEYV
ncbi:MAG: glycosyltransferase family 4 protein [Candidatus Moraniibacteriota bacterium]|nr:MAG: glycosyltransferase family 4 protein [Candidatus Moranbacteria bacterium]